MRFTIVSALLNGGPAMEDTVHSLLEQTHADWELLVQDGGSTDACPDFLQALDDPRIRLCCEKDSGIYDAWNKAVPRIEGDWAIFLGAGDFLLEPTVLERCAAHLKNAPEHMLFAYGEMFIGRRGYPRQRVRRSLRTVYSMLFTEMGLPFTATFVRAEALRSRSFDSSFRISGDYDFVAGLISRDNVLRLPLAVSFMEEGGISGNDAYTPLFKEERRRVVERHIIPKAEELAQACLAHLEDSACCGAGKKIRLGERLRLFWKLRRGGRKGVAALKK